MLLTDAEKAKFALRKINSTLNKKDFPKALEESFEKLKLIGQSVLADASLSNEEFDELFPIWNLIQHDLPDEIVDLLLRKMFINITATAKVIKNLRASVTLLNVKGNEMIGNLEKEIYALNEKISGETQDLTKLEENIQKIKQNISSLRRKISGSSGFWKGFSEGITAGIYHPVDDNLNEQERLLRDYKRAHISALNKLQQIKNDKLELEHSQTSLNDIINLDDSTVSLENCMQSLCSLVSKTHHSDGRVVSTDNDKISNFFRKRFDKYMKELATWRDVFK